MTEDAALHARVLGSRSGCPKTALSVILSAAKNPRGAISSLFAWEMFRVPGPATYFVYILTNRTRTLYVGVTNDLVRRAYEHRSGEIPGFTSRYKIHHLVYFEQFQDIGQAIAREKQIKGWLRSRKVELIEGVNPGWKDLSREWLPDK